MAYTDLKNSIGTGTLDTGGALSASAVRRLACEASITPVVLGSHSEILDVGRTQRLVTAAIWKALQLRDEHCTFPGCTRLPIACDAHHTLIHTTPWQIWLNPVDKRPEFIPPARLDPEQKPIRHRELRT